MTVAQLIEILQDIDNKDKSVFIYNMHDGNMKLVTSMDIDLNIDDRLDINVNFAE